MNKHKNGDVLSLTQLSLFGGQEVDGHRFNKQHTKKIKVGDEKRLNKRSKKEKTQDKSKSEVEDDKRQLSIFNDDDFKNESFARTKKILTEVFNIKNAVQTAKDGHSYKIAYIDPETSENIYSHKTEIQKFGAKFFGNIKAWGWFLGTNPEEVYQSKIKPCLDYLLSIEDNGLGTRRGKVLEIIDQLIEEINNGNVGSAENKSINTKTLQQELINFKRELMSCMSSEDFKKKFEPIIKFQQAQGHVVSLRNAILIIMQDPQATLVKSKTKWFSFNRTIITPNKPIVLWRPDKEKLSKEEKERIKRAFLTANGASSVRDLNPGQKEELYVQLSGGKLKDDNRSSFKPYLAYDVRFTQQMEGKEDLVGNRNSDDVPWFDDSGEETDQTKSYTNALLHAIKSSGIKVGEVNDLGGARGVSKSGSIDVLANTSKNSGLFNTLTHEFAHELLHQRYLQNKQNGSEWASFFVGTTQGRGVVEQQAELTAWIVLKHFGYDMPTNINYVALWGMDENNACKVFDTVSDVATFIIKKIGENLDNNNRYINDEDYE